MKLELWKKRKKELKLNYSEIAELSGVSKRTVEDLFRGFTQNPRIDTVEAIERTLGIGGDDWERLHGPIGRIFESGGGEVFLCLSPICPQKFLIKNRVRISPLRRGFLFIGRRIGDSFADIYKRKSAKRRTSVEFFGGI